MRSWLKDNVRDCGLEGGCGIYGHFEVLGFWFVEARALWEVQRGWFYLHYVNKGPDRDPLNLNRITNLGLSQSKPATSVGEF
jgi:hypothetical protein